MLPSFTFHFSLKSNQLVLLKVPSFPRYGKQEKFTEFGKNAEFTEFHGKQTKYNFLWKKKKKNRKNTVNKLKKQKQKPIKQNFACALNRHQTCLQCLRVLTVHNCSVICFVQCHQRSQNLKLRLHRRTRIWQFRKRKTGDYCFTLRKRRNW